VKKFLRLIATGLSVAALIAAVMTTMTTGTASAAARPHAGPCSFGPMPSGSFGIGTTGPGVKSLQCDLDFIYSNHPAEQIAIDGIFGPATQGLVENFQACVHITVDGIVGPQTKNRISILLQDPNPNAC